MKSQILLLAITAAAISSCTSAYRTGQTPDDVYYSPVTPHDEYVRVEDKDDRYYHYDDQYYDDRYLRMKVQNRVLWNDLDDWYNYDRYSYTYNYYWGTYNNPYNSWNYYYNPYCHSNNKVVVVYPKQPLAQTTFTKPRSFNLAGYTNNNYNNRNIFTNAKTAPTPGVSRLVLTNSNTSNKSNSKGFGNSVRQIFSGNNNNSFKFNNSNNSSNSGTNNRSYTPSNSSNNNSSNKSSGSGSGNVSRPGRGGN